MASLTLSHGLLAISPPNIKSPQATNNHVINPLKFEPVYAPPYTSWLKKLPHRPLICPKNTDGAPISKVVAKSNGGLKSLIYVTTASPPTIIPP